MLFCYFRVWQVNLKPASQQADSIIFRSKIHVLKEKLWGSEAKPRIGALTLKGECWSTHGRWPLAMNCTTAMASNPNSNYENTRPAERLFNKLKPNANFQAETSNRKSTGMMLQKLQQNLTRPTVQLTLRFDSNVSTLAAWDHLRIPLPSNTQLDLAAVVIRTKHLEVVPSSLQRHNTFRSIRGSLVLLGHQLGATITMALYSSPTSQKYPEITCRSCRIQMFK